MFLWLILLVLVVGGCASPQAPWTPTPTPRFLGGKSFLIPTPDSQPTGITTGPDGAIWFTELSSEERIGRITPAGDLTEFPLPEPGAGPRDITAGPDGALWFTEAWGGIGRITPQGTVTEFKVSVPDSTPEGIATGPDGALWFTEANIRDVPGSAHIDEVGRITPMGALSTFQLPMGAAPRGITAGPDGALWFTEGGSNKIGRITVAGTITEFPLPTAKSFPRTITPGPDGALWFTEAATNEIGRITPTGVITEFQIPAGSAPWGITAGPDGALWFTEAVGPVLGRLTVAGVFSDLGGAVSEFTGGGEAPQRSFDPRGITAGPGNTLWFTEAGVNQIAKYTLNLPLARPTATATGG